MRSILFSIPLDGRIDLGPLGQIPVFGVGLLLAVWCLIGAGYAIFTVRRAGWKGLGPIVLVVWAVVAVAIFKAAEMNVKAVPVYGYGTMLFVGFLASASLSARRLRQEGADGEIAWDAAMWIFISGILGGRVFYVIQYHDKFFGPDPLTGHPRTAMQVISALVNLPDGGLVLYGSLIFAPLAYYLFCRMRGVRPLALADIAITSVFVGITFGRLGCLLHGCCYGDVCSLPWAMTFPAHSVPFESLVSRGLLAEEAPASLALHPTQLYDSLSGFLLALVTWAYYPYRRRSGDVLAVGWMAYPINRFLIEFLRSDENSFELLRLVIKLLRLDKLFRLDECYIGPSLTIAQWVSLGLLASGIAFYVILRYWSAEKQSVLVAPPASAKAA